MTAPSTLHIDLGRLAANVRAWRGFLQAGRDAPPPKLCAIVKADAYSLGAVACSRTLLGAGVDMLAVYSLDQACDLLAAGIDAPILVLMPTRRFPMQEPLIDAFRRGRMHLSIDSTDALLDLQQFAASVDGVGCVHLNLDTGMSRAGMSPSQFTAALGRTAELDHLRLAGCYTHFAAPADDPDFTDQQLAAFDDALARHADAIGDDVLIHTAGTFAALRHRRTHRDMVRLGLGLYGYGPEIMAREAVESDPPNLQPIARWTSRVIHVQHVPAGRSVGYHRTHTLGRDTVLGIVPVGHGDGYPVGLSNRACVELAGGRAVPLLGVVNMDQIIIDLTDAGDDIAVGAEVTLLSDDPKSPCHPARLAELAGTNIYEILCRLSARLPRVYHTTGSGATARTADRADATR